MSDLNNGTILPKIACVLDEFSYNCFKYEADFISLDAEKWQETLNNEKPDMLFVESAWNESFNKLFRHGSQGTNAFSNPVNWCKKHKIPTVFWNKEDPIYFNHFIEIAKGFDYIFTTDSDSIPQYKRITGHERVYLLPFAAQLRIHNPIDKDAGKLGKVAFAGTWYKRLPVRTKEMEILLKPALKYGLHIYDRMHDSGSKRYMFPKMYQPYIKGSLPYEKMVSVYKKYDIFLNVNTVKTSPTMLARRVIELLACGINVISNDSLAIKRMFPGIVQVCENEEDAEKHMNLLTHDNNLRDRLSLLGQRAVFQKHTYTHRMEMIGEIVGLNYKGRGTPGVSVVSVVNRQASIEHIIANFERQNHPYKELILILKNGSIDLKGWEEKINHSHGIKFYLYEEQKKLVNAINEGISMARFEFISFFGEDNYYAPDFTGDLMNAFQYSQAEIVGKGTYYAYLKDFKSLFMRFPNHENCFVDSLLGSAMIVRKEILEKVKLSDPSDTWFPKSSNIFQDFIKDCKNKGFKLYASDRFNFVYIDSSNSSADFQKTFSDCTWRMVASTDSYETHVVL